MRTAPHALLAIAFLLLSGAEPEEGSGFSRALATAEEALASGDLDVARRAVRAALERDASSARAWHLAAEHAHATGDRDREVWALHRELELVQAQELRGAAELRARLIELDPIASDLFGLKAKYAKKLRPVAAAYERQGWPHAAIRVHQEILALDPVDPESLQAIERLASSPDRALAAHARPRDLLSGVSREWIAEHDAEHATWDEHAVLEREHYVTRTDAGYEVLVRAAEAMEHMNAFYREFFEYGSGARAKATVPRIELRIFATREEYLEHGSSPAEWSGGQYTGAAVETYVGSGGFVGMTGTLFHEAAHQFVDLATNAAGWLNEGLASFFEGSRLLANGSVVPNAPANHRLFALVSRLERGWMSTPDEGITEDPSVVPERAPRFRTVLENDYEWGPAWYAPTWGVVYFLYNFQDPADGRFVYRDAFREYVNRSGGLAGETAVDVFEEVVLGNPEPLTRDLRSRLELPASVDELDELWKDWLTDLRDEQSGRRKTEHPFKEWAKHATTRVAIDDAEEFYEKGLVETPDDPELLTRFGEFLVTWREDEDRAVDLFLRAEALLEDEGAPLAEEAGRWLAKLDDRRRELEGIRTALEQDALALPERYLGAQLERMAYEVALRLGRELDLPSMYAACQKAIEAEGEAPEIWTLAYDEEGLSGWQAAPSFRAEGPELAADFGTYATGDFAYRFMALDVVTSGDYSMEAEVQVLEDRSVFAGIVFGQKSANDFHALILFPPRGTNPRYVDLATFYGGDENATWRHETVDDEATVSKDADEAWHRLRIDVTGSVADMWVNDTYLARQAFSSRAVLAGNFGVITGLGQARFRNVRYIARDPGDPTAEILRAGVAGSAPRQPARTARTALADDVDTSENGSWLDKRPAFPQVLHWVRGERSTWSERAGRPQLLVLWSIAQNDLVRIDAWLNHFAEENAKFGLEVVSIAHTWDAGRVPTYLESYPFPGVVGIDARPDGDGNLGRTFTAYAVDRFQLPRVILLDVDGRVVWEGEPGFSAGSAWRPGDRTFVDVPMDRLVRERSLLEVAGWRERWSSAAEAPLIERIPLLAEARGFDGGAFPEVREALALLTRLEDAIATFDATVEVLEAQGRAPAARPLADWAELIGAPVPKSSRSALERSLGVKHWERALGFLKPALRDLEAGKDPRLNERALARLDEVEGAFADELYAALIAAIEDPVETGRIVSSAAGLPAAWLEANYFGD